MVAVCSAVDAEACEPLPTRCARLAPVFREAAARHGLPTELLVALAVVESRCDPTAESHRGALGVLQMLPETFTRVARHTGGRDPLDPIDNILAGAFYLAALVHAFDAADAGRSWVLALAAYNCGPRRVPDRVPSATWGYVADVLETYECLGGRPP